MSVVKVDFSNKVKPIKPVHGVCCAPYVQSGTQPHVEKYFKEGFTPAELGAYAGIAQQYLFYYERYIVN